MLTKGRISSPFTHIVATSKTNYELDQDVAPVTFKQSFRRQGLFCLKIFDSIPLPDNINNYIALKAIYLDNGLHTFNDKYDGCNVFLDGQLASHSRQGQYCCRDFNDYLLQLIDDSVLRMKIFTVTNNRLKINAREGEKIVFTPKSATTLGLPDIVFEGPLQYEAPLPIALVSSFQPLVLTFPHIEDSFLGSGLAPILSVVSPPSMSDSRCIIQENETLHWKKLISPLQDYIYLSVKDALGNEVSFSENSDITIHLIVRSSPYDII